MIKEILNCKPLTVASNKFVVEGNLTSNKAEIAQAFNEQYKNAGPRLAEALPSPTRHYLSFMRAPNRDSLFLQNVLPDEVRTIIRSLKDSASGWDGISVKILKQSCETLLNPIVQVLNLSLSHGIVPSEMKRAKVMPLFKKGDPEVTLNYRPISVLPSLSKIREKVMHTRLSSFLAKHDILF